jgi:predicted transcriptional regulator YdeE
MADRPNPVFRTVEEVSLIGTMATYDSQAEASQGIPQQWRAFRLVWYAKTPSVLYWA